MIRLCVKSILAVSLCLLALQVQAAGFRLLTIAADAQGPALRGAVWYPSTQPVAALQLGPYGLSLARDAPMSGGQHALVVISHGWGGSFLGHRDLAATLADAGFVVVAINHGDNFQSPRRFGDQSVLIERPDDIKRVVDYMLGTWPQASGIDARRIGFFGFSRGGYTGLVAAGATPDIGDLQAICAGNHTPACRRVQDGRAAVWTHEPRIRAAVIADPLSDVFDAAGLQSVKVPLQLWSSQHGGDGVSPAAVARLARGLPATHEFHVVAQAGHFAFLPPCPALLAQQTPELCTDQPGFDRGAFHRAMNSDVLAFLRSQLLAPR